jgi:MFS superfamily sulfate permease-like transporter
VPGSEKKHHGPYSNPNNLTGLVISSLSVPHWHRMGSRSPLLSESSPLIPVTTRASKIRDRISYYVPIISWLPSYRPREQFRGDFLAGLTLAFLLIPQSISYATSLAHLSPLSGLFSASVPAFFYAIFGSSRHLNVAPEAALSLLIGQTIRSSVPAGDDEDQIFEDSVTITTVIMFQAGLFAFLLGFFRLGFIDVVLSRALLRGFVTAIALIIAM